MLNHFVRWETGENIVLLKRKVEEQVAAPARPTLTLDEGEDLLILLFGLTLLHQVNLVLQDEDVLQLHDLDGSQMLRCLRLRTWLVAR